MRILIDFINGNDSQHEKVLASAKQGGEVLSDPGFLDKIRAWPQFDFTGDTNAQIADKIKSAGDVMIKVGLYRSKWPWSKTIASESDGEVWFNTRQPDAGGVENTVHEFMHALGYSHNGNSPAGQENTVPWRVGAWAGVWQVKAPVCKVEVVT